MCVTLLVRSRKGSTMRGGLKLSNSLRALGFLALRARLAARKLRGAVQRCSECCVEAREATDSGSQAGSRGKGVACELGV